LTSCDTRRDERVPLRVISKPRERLLLPLLLLLLLLPPMLLLLLLPPMLLLLLPLPPLLLLRRDS
jgi:hypothetical protein